MSEERKENIQTGNPLGEASVIYWTGCWHTWQC